MITLGVDIRVLGTGRRSGIEEYTEQIVAHMIALAPVIHWKLFYSGRTPLVRRAWMDAPNVSIYETGLSNRLLWLSSALFHRPKLDRLVGGADAFFFPHFLLGALSSSCKRIMTWHDLSYEKMPYLLSPYRRLWHALQMRPRAQAQMSNRIISVSAATAQDVVDTYGIPASRVAVVASGIDASIRRVSEADIASWRAHRNIQAPFVLALGTREPRKNLPALIRAWDRARKEPAFRSVHLVLAGESGWMERDIELARAATHTPHEVRIMEGVGRDERSVILSAASLLAYPSLMEGFGFPPLEAMACGTPVLAGATSSLFETVGDAGLLANPYRNDELVAGLLALHTDLSLRSRMIGRGLERAALFSWQRAAQATLAEILSVLE